MSCIGIIDYGAGNLMSAVNSLKFLGFDCIVSSEPERLASADKLILPGVGAFPAAMERLNSTGLADFIRHQSPFKPLLGICLGMQLLFDSSDEVRYCRGLSLISGSIRKLDTDYKLPHIGWNSLRLLQASQLLRGVPSGSFVYFVHSYCAHVAEPENLTAITDYGTDVTAVVQSGKIFGCQFHPEKSGDTGLLIYKNFAELN